MNLEEEETLLQDLSAETSDVELKHILFPHVNDHVLIGDGDMSRYFTDTQPFFINTPSLTVIYIYKTAVYRENHRRRMLLTSLIT